MRDWHHSVPGMVGKGIARSFFQGDTASAGQRGANGIIRVASKQKAPSCRLGRAREREQTHPLQSESFPLWLETVVQTES
jgi:hypothetical protein